VRALPRGHLSRCRGRHREDKISEEFVELCQEGIEQCIECIEEKLYLEFSEKTELLKTLENSARRALSWCRSAQKGLF
jgi:hypothetical protein